MKVKRTVLVFYFGLFLLFDFVVVVFWGVFFSFFFGEVFLFLLFHFWLLKSVAIEGGGIKIRKKKHCNIFLFILLKVYVAYY